MVELNLRGIEYKCAVGYDEKGHSIPGVRYLPSVFFTESDVAMLENGSNAEASEYFFEEGVRIGQSEAASKISEDEMRKITVQSFIATNVRPSKASAGPRDLSQGYNFGKQLADVHARFPNALKKLGFVQGLAD